MVRVNRDNAQLVIDTLREFHPAIYKRAIDIRINPDYQAELIVTTNDGRRWLFMWQGEELRLLPDSYELSNEDFKQEFAIRFSRALRLSPFSSYQQLSEATGISVTTLSYYGTGKVIPNFYNLDILARALNMPVDYFRYRDISEETENLCNVNYQLDAKSEQQQQ